MTEQNRPPRQEGFSLARQRNRGPRSFPLEIKRVIDGDGFEALIYGTPETEEPINEIRLFGIDAPELAQPFGQESANHLASLVNDGRFYMEVVNDDNYGRSVAIVYRNSFEHKDTLNYKMVAAGWAYWYEDYDPEDRLGLREAQAEAFFRGVGIWRDGGNEERPWDFKERVRRESEEKARFEADAVRAEQEANEVRGRQGTQQGAQNYVSTWRQEAEVIIERAQAYLAENKVGLAIAECREAEKRTPTNPLIYTIRARAHIENRVYFRAIEDCKRALVYDKNNGLAKELLEFARRKESETVLANRKKSESASSGSMRQFNTGSASQNQPRRKRRWWQIGSGN